MFNFEYTPLIRNPDVELKDAGEEAFLVQSGGEQLFPLNPLAVAVWRLLSHPLSGRKISTVVHTAFPLMSLDKVDEDVHAIITTLLVQGYVEAKRE